MKSHAACKTPLESTTVLVDCNKSYGREFCGCVYSDRGAVYLLENTCQKKLFTVQLNIQWW